MPSCAAERHLARELLLSSISSLRQRSAEPRTSFIAEAWGGLYVQLPVSVRGSGQRGVCIEACASLCGSGKGERGSPRVAASGVSHDPVCVSWDSVRGCVRRVCRSAAIGLSACKLSHTSVLHFSTLRGFLRNWTASGCRRNADVKQRRPRRARASECVPPLSRSAGKDVLMLARRERGHLDIGRLSAWGTPVVGQ